MRHPFDFCIKIFLINLLAKKMQSGPQSQLRLQFTKRILNSSFSTSLKLELFVELCALRVFARNQLAKNVLPNKHDVSDPAFLPKHLSAY
jgi:hypothetical protein